MAEKNIEIGGRLHSIATGNVLAGANEIFDDDKNKKQSDINTETYTLVNDVNERLNGLSPDQQSALTVAAKATNNETKLGYYVCGTEGNVAAKVISDATGYILSKGGSMKVKMTNANTAANATLNINSTGAKPLYYDGERASTNNSWEAGETVEVYYDGTNFYANNVAGGSGSGDGTFDISAKTGQNYETLSAALTAANTILPASKKKGGMSIKFIQTTPAKYTVIKTEGATEQPTGTELQSDPGIISGTYTAGELSSFSTLPATLNSSLTYYLTVIETVDEQEVTTYTTWVITYVQSSDNKYVQYRLKADEWSTNTDDWAIYSESVYVENPEFIYVKTDTEGKILWAIKTDGGIYYGAGVPKQVVDYINEKIAELSLEDIVTFLGELINGDKTLAELLSEIDAALEETEADVDAKIAAFEEKFSFLDVIDDVENRREILVDSEDRVVSYRDKDGVLHENVGIETPQLNAYKVKTPVVNTEKIEGLTTEGLSDLEKALKDNGFDKGHGDWSSYISNDGDNPLPLPTPRCAIVNITNDNNNAVWPTSKTADYEYYLEYLDMQGNYFKKKVIYNAQGNSSLSMPKKNGAFDLFDSDWDGDAFSIKFGDWVPQDSFHLKAYYADYFVGVGAIGYKLFNQITNTRDVFTNRDWKKALLPSKATIGVDCRALADFDDKYSLDNDARCFPDGFPCIVYLNGDFYGVYSWQLKKHRDNYMMSKKKPLHIHLDGVIDSERLFGANGDASLIGWVDVNDTGFEIRNPKPKKKSDGWDLTCIDGTKYDADTNMQEIIGEDAPLYDSSNASHVNTNKTKKAILQLSTYITELEEMEANEATDAEIRERLAEMFDIESFVDYLIFSDAISNFDGFRKNWQWITWDGEKWYVEPYDLDGIFGWSGWGQVDYNGNRYGNDKTIPSGWIIQYYQTELEARYAKLRESGILTTDNILKIFREWIAAIGTDNMQLNHDKWPNDKDHYSAGPVLTHYDSIYRVANWIEGRITKCDDIYNYSN